MPWKEFQREDRFKGSGKPFVSITASHFSFNATFTRQANLKSYRYVTIYVDPEEKKLGFQFHNDERENSFKLSEQSSHKRGVKRTGMQCASRGIAFQFDWVKKATELPASKRRFEPKQDGNLWVIQIGDK